MSACIDTSAFYAYLKAAIGDNDFRSLSIDAEAAERACTLPWRHRDPWDRLLIAQALNNGLTLVSRDGVFAAYRVSLLW